MFCDCLDVIRTVGALLSSGNNVLPLQFINLNNCKILKTRPTDVCSNCQMSKLYMYKDVHQDFAGGEWFVSNCIHVLTDRWDPVLHYVWQKVSNVPCR